MSIPERTGRNYERNVTEIRKRQAPGSRLSRIVISATLAKTAAAPFERDAAD
jgi:hypothetical protein